MPEPFEDPRKTDMRGRCEVAIDAAGYELVAAPVARQVPGLNGAIRGDLQSLDGEDVRCAYYLRPEGDKPVPQWIVTLAEAARDLGDLRLFVVVTRVSEVLEKSCRAAGVGLLHLTQEDTFDLVVDPDEIDPAALQEQLRARVEDARRRLELKLNLNKSALEENYSRVNDLTTGMPQKTRDDYIEKVEEAINRWEGWSQRISEMLDEARSTSNEQLLEAAENLIEEGAED